MKNNYEEILDSTNKFENFFSEVESSYGKYLYPLRQSKTADFSIGYGLQVVSFTPVAEGGPREPVRECIIPMAFDQNGIFSLTYELLNAYTVTTASGGGYFFETRNGDVPFDDDWKFVTKAQRISPENGFYASLNVKKDLTPDKRYVVFRVGGARRPDPEEVKSLQGYSQLSVSGRKQYFDSASRVVLGSDSERRYAFYERILEGDWSTTIGPGDEFSLYQYRRQDPEECDASFNPEAIKVYSAEANNYGLGKKYIRFKIVEYRGRG